MDTSLTADYMGMLAHCYDALVAVSMLYKTYEWFSKFSDSLILFEQVSNLNNIHVQSHLRRFI